MNHAMSIMRRNLATTSNLIAAATLRRHLTQPRTNTLHCNNKLLQQYRGFICSQCTHKRTYSTPPPPKDTPTEKVTVDMSKKRRNVKPPLGWAGLGVILAAGSGLIWYVRQVKEETVEEQKRRDTKRIGKPSIGGPFTLVNTKGEEVTEQDFIGKWVLVYFGFCNCPDICPDQLDKITEVVNRVNSTPHIPNIQPVYITVDPLRDTPQIMDEYLQDFHPDFIGLTGTVEQVKAACKTYRVYYSEGPKDEDEDYIVDHTVISYLVRPNGDFCHYYGQDKGVNETVNDVNMRIGLKE